MLRWLMTLCGLVFGLLMLIGCAAGDTAAAKSPASFHKRTEVYAGQNLASEAAPQEASFTDDALDSDQSPAPAPVAAKEVPVMKVAHATTTAPTPTGPSFGAQAPHVTDLIIYTATVTMAVYQVEPGLDAVEKIARELGGYLAQRSDKSITVRVPRGKFDDALRRVQASGDVLHRDVNAEDVTDQYVELETRLKNARSMRDRLEQLLARAAVKEAVEIEKELGRVTGDIEAMEGKLKVLRDKIAYSTITVVFEPRGASAVRDVPLRLPFGWLGGLGLPRLLSLGEGQ
jgi:hypothetical protein